MIDAVSWLSSRIASSGVGKVDSLASAQRVALDQANGPSFSQVLEQISSEAVNTLRAAEATSISALQGQASTMEVVEAIKAAEQALQTATAVRDKVVQAYQEVSRMAI
jgi:flagellar hook-basal body complex protein FliE